ncbi:hypothetical protein CRM22_000787, partial [Opisthorchis felineus]
PRRSLWLQQEVPLASHLFPSVLFRSLCSRLFQDTFEDFKQLRVRQQLILTGTLSATHI